MKKSEHEFETEGDMRKFVEANPEKAIRVDWEPDPGYIEFLVHEGEFTIVLSPREDGADFEPYTTEPVGDDAEIMGETEIIDADEIVVPE